MTEIVLMAAAITTVGVLITALFPIVERYVRRRTPQYVELGDKPTEPISSSEAAIPSPKKILKSIRSNRRRLGITNIDSVLESNRRKCG